MFKAANPYDEIVAKATDEKQTEVNWDTLLSVWDKVADEGETGARNCVAAIQKRLQHRSANVQLFSLTLAGALVNNCGPPLHREISSKAFTQALVRLINDRTTHDQVKKQALKAIDDWVKEHPNNTDFDLMADTHDSLKKQGLKFEAERPKSPPRRTDDSLKREEEDLQRALAESAALADPRRGYTPSKALPDQPTNNHNPAPPPPPPAAAPSRVRALYNFAPQTAEELGFQVGDVIRVLECVYEAWWKGELRGQVGIFPANHVEAIEEEEEAQGAAAGGGDEGEMEAELFGQAGMVDKLLVMMRGMQGQGKNVADNDELIELYQKSMALRPKVVKLIERYEQKQADLHEMNQKFARAASTYEAIIARQQQHHQPQPVQHHQSPQQNGGYAPQPGPSHFQPQPQPQPQQGQGQQVDPYAGWTEQQRREYDAQWAAYHQQMADYEKAQAEYQRQQAAAQQQQQQPMPAQSAQSGRAGAGEPVWDGQQWVHPQQQQAQPYQQGPPPPEQLHQPPPPQQVSSPVSSHPSAAAAGTGYYPPAQPAQAHQLEHATSNPAASYPAQPYPDVAPQAAPQHTGGGAYGLSEQMSALSVNGQHSQPGPAGASIEYHPHQAPAQEQAYGAAPLGVPPVASPGLQQVQMQGYAGQGEQQGQAQGPQQGGYAAVDPHYPEPQQAWAGQQ